MVGQRGEGRSKATGLFWGPPQKSPPSGSGEEAGPGGAIPHGSTLPFDSLSPGPKGSPLPENTLRCKVCPKNLVSQLPIASDVATNLKNTAS
jgi:hypothetical protein